MYAMTNEDRIKVGLTALKFKTESYINKTLPDQGMLSLSHNDMFRDPKMLLKRVNNRMEAYDNGFDQE